MKWLSRISVFIFLLLILIIFIFNGCMTFRTSDKASMEYFEKRNVPVEIRRFSFEGKSLRYLESGKKESVAPLIVFVHGAPGSADNFYSYLADSLLLQKARMVTLDRLGYGYSAYGKSEISIAKQAAAIRALVDQFDNDTIILVGHSYGGPIVGKYAMDFPNRVATAIMLAPLNDPNSEPIFWFAHFARWKLTKWMLSKPLQVSGDEKFSHAAELKKIEKDWQSIQVPIIHIHGDKDRLAPPQENIDFSKKYIPAQYLKMIVLPDTDHFIPWSDFELIRQELLLLLK